MRSPFSSKDLFHVGYTPYLDSVHCRICPLHPVNSVLVRPFGFALGESCSGIVHSFYLHNFANVFRHYEYMKACIYGLSARPLSKDIPELVDHRYFYDEPDPRGPWFVGCYTCGICRNAVAGILLAHRLHYKDRDFLQSLPDYITNPSVAGFMVEQAVLQAISIYGLSFTKLLHQSMDAVAFTDIPSFDTTGNEPVLYIPRVFNFNTSMG